MSKSYERELKGILQADEKVLSSTVKTCDSLEQAAYEKIKTKPFVVIRSAGSLNVDVVAIRGDICFPVEVKSTATEIVHLNSPRLMEQAARLRENCRRAGLTPIYAVRLKGARGDAWRVFTMELDGLTGTQRILYNMLPKMEHTQSGNYIIRWNDGMPMHKFIEYLCQ